jgi:hypothetical protein
MRDLDSLFLGAALALSACAGGAQPAQAPEGETLESGANTPAVSAESSEPSEGSTAEAPPSASDSPAASESSSAEPAFTENMSVAEAQKAVPRGVDRANLDPETLSKPLQNLELYESCKAGAAKVKLAVAVWNGKAVGVDVTTTPKNDALSECVKGKIRELTWDKKVKSLNTVEYQF